MRAYAIVFSSKTTKLLIYDTSVKLLSGSIKCSVCHDWELHGKLYGGHPGRFFMRKAAIIILGIGLVVLGAVWSFKDIYGESIAGTAEDIAVNMVAVKINESLINGFYDEKLDGPLLKIERDKEGNIKYIEPDTRLINKLVLEFASGVRENYDSEEISVCKVNLGVLTGSKFMSQIPFYTRIRVQPLSLTKITSSTGFETQGINQTRYFVHCNVQSQVRILAPFTNKTAEINRSYQLAEAIIVGQVPSSYVYVPEESILDAAEF